MLLLLLVGTAAGAQTRTYPTKPVQIVVAFSAGGAVDTVARVLAQSLSDRLGQPFVVENRPGASGGIGAQSVAKAAPDGYTLLMAPITSYAMSATLLRTVQSFDLAKDFAPVATIGDVPLLLVVHPSVPARTLSEFVALAKAKPGQLTYGSSGNGSTEHLAAALFNRLAGTEMLHVPYKGGAPAMNDLIGGQINSVVATSPTALPHVRAGSVKALAVATKERLSVLPDVPTAAEAGLAGFEVSSVYGILAPAAMPRPIVDQLAAEIGAIVKQPEIREKLLVTGVVARSAGPDETGTRLRGELERWAKVIDDAKITAE
jgi:tripartite-type tricarboxylate transporter receptor subunit TctC